MKKLYYISFIRFPSEKAHSIYTAKHCDSFSKLGYDVTLIIPKRFGIDIENLKSFYNTNFDFVVKKFPVVDLLPFPYIKAFSHRLGLVTFGIGVFFYVLLSIPKSSYISTPDVFIAYLIGFVHKRVVYEVHDYPEANFWVYQTVFKKMYKIQTNNYQKIDKIVKDFDISRDKIFAVHNGVTIKDFDIDVSKIEAQRKLGLDINEKYAVYTGHLYGWKGVDTLAQAAADIPGITILFVGGTTDDVHRMKIQYEDIPNIKFLGHKVHSLMPLYQKAANVLVLPNTAKDEVSFLHTSPMKLFEYMASKRPIIASEIPSICEILNKENSVLVQADSPRELAIAIKKTIEYPLANKIQQAFKDVSVYTWNRRAVKIMNNLEKIQE